MTLFILKRNETSEKKCSDINFRQTSELPYFTKTNRKTAKYTEGGIFFIKNGIQMFQILFGNPFWFTKFAAFL
jgi:hypothetical protein